MAKSIKYSWKALLLGGLFFLSGCSRHYEARFPIDYIPSSGLPRTEVKIEDNFYPFVIDLGDSSYFAVSQELLKNLQNKHPSQPIDSIDMKGNEYVSKTYLLPEIAIRNIRLQNIKVTEETLDFLQNTSIYQGTKRTSAEKIRDKPGRIGRRLFVENYNLLLDFHNSVMFACCHLRHRKKDGYRINQLVQIPFGIGLEEGIFFEVDTDLGPKTFMLDTGATHTFIKPSHIQDLPLEERHPGLYCYYSSSFVIGKKDFGPQPLVLFEMGSIFENIDGVLGMDFLKEHVVYLDFDKKIAYIGKASEVSSDIRVPSYVIPGAR